MYGQSLHYEFTWYKFHIIRVLHFGAIYSCHSLTLGMIIIIINSPNSEVRYYRVYP